MFGKKKKKSFIEKLTGSVHVDDFEEDFEMEEEMGHEAGHRHMDVELNDQEVATESDLEALEPDGDGQLAVDVFNTDDSIIVKAMAAGVRPGDLDIDISRDMITIHGTRIEDDEVSEENYYHKELYWGSFSRNVLLPEEIDVDESEAVEKHGLITLTLPKLDKSKKTKLQVKSK